MKKNGKFFLGTVVFLVVVFMLLFSCSRKEDAVSSEAFNSWEDVVKEGRSGEVSIYMWGGNEQVNQYMDGWVSPGLRDLYDIELKRVPSVPPEYLKKLLNEKRAGLNQGTADLLWINAENFRTAIDGQLLWGPFTDLLANQKKYYNPSADDLNWDAGIEINGFEAIWGRAQLVLTYDKAEMSSPPRTYAELAEWVRDHPGRFTYPVLPDDFAGSAFVRTAYFEITGQTDIFHSDLGREEFEELSVPVMDYFNSIKPYLWRKGETYPKSQAQQDELFKNGELLMTMGFEIGKASGQILQGVYPDTVRTFVFDSGTVGNSHYLAIPFNAPNKAAALLVIDFLQSPEAQIEKLKPDVWGDMAAFDAQRLDDQQRDKLSEVDLGPATLSMEELADHRNADMAQKYIGWIEEIWARDVAGK